MNLISFLRLYHKTAEISSLFQRLREKFEIYLKRNKKSAENVLTTGNFYATM